MLRAAAVITALPVTGLPYVGKMLIGYILTAGVALIVGFFSVRSTDRYKRHQDKREKLTLECDEVLDRVATIHEAGQMEQSDLGDLVIHLRLLQRAADWYLDGREPTVADLQSRRLKLSITRRRQIDARIAATLSSDLRFRVRDLPHRADQYDRELVQSDKGEASARTHNHLLSEVRDSARIALTLRDAVTGRPDGRNRGLQNKTSDYLFSHGRLPNWTAADRVGATDPRW